MLPQSISFLLANLPKCIFAQAANSYIFTKVLVLPQLCKSPKIWTETTTCCLICLDSAVLLLTGQSRILTPHQLCSIYISPTSHISCSCFQCLCNCNLRLAFVPTLFFLLVLFVKCQWCLYDDAFVLLFMSFYVYVSLYHGMRICMVSSFVKRCTLLFK